MLNRFISNRGLAISSFMLAFTMSACDMESLYSKNYSAPAATRFPRTSDTPTKANIITNAVMAKKVKEDTFEPIGITDVFPANQDIFHAVVTITDAPEDTVFSALWLTSSDYKVGFAEFKAGGSGNIDFSLTPADGMLPGGDYKIEIYVDGSLNRTLNFSVEQSPQEASITTTSAAETIQEIVLAKNTEGSEAEPVDPTTVFEPDSTIHAVVRINEAPAGTKYEASWFVIDAGEDVEKNALINKTNITTDGTRNIDFTLRPLKSFPPGSYRVDISVNGVFHSSETFTIK
jgi:hypothetical protein